ncbi:hypothetical protein X975_09894, partial [Stegodyphus mimosarum]
MSALMSLENYAHCSHPIVTRILKLNHTLKNRRYQVLYSWIPGHVAISRNGLVDIAAKTATTMCNPQIPLADIKEFVKSKILSKWQRQWDDKVYNKLRNVKPAIEYWPCMANRREDALLTRLRIGHRRLKGEKNPRCTNCNADLTVRHILVECQTFNYFRQKHFNCSELDLRNLMGKTHHRNLFLFLKDIGFYVIFCLFRIRQKGLEPAAPTVRQQQQRFGGEIIMESQFAMLVAFTSSCITCSENNFILNESS